MEILLKIVLYIYLFGAMFGLYLWGIGHVLIKKIDSTETVKSLLWIFLSWYGLFRIYQWIKRSETYTWKEILYTLFLLIGLFGFVAILEYMNTHYLEKALSEIDILTSIGLMFGFGILSIFLIFFIKIVYTLIKKKR